MKIIEKEIEKLIPYALNSRTHSDEQIAQISASIKEFGFNNPILIDEKDGIIAGHGRVLGAKKLGLNKVPTIKLAHLTPNQRKAYIIADNKLALNAGWDMEMLSLEMGDLDKEGFDLSLIGFDDNELATILADKNEGLTDPDEVPDLPDEPVTKEGDVWLLGKHRLMCGDSTVETSVTKLLAGVEPHLMVTDPPYGVNYNAAWRNDAAAKGLIGQRRSTRAIGRVENDNQADWSDAWALFSGDVAYVWHAGNKAHIVAESLEENELNIRAQIIWAKNNMVIGRGDYHPKHEPCWYAVRKNKKGHYVGGRKQTTVWDINKPLKSETGHSTQKPVECMKRPIENNSSPGQAVYEPFSGSGTTIIAGEMTGRCVYAMELSPAYVDVAVKRWQDFTGEKAKLEDSGEIFPTIKADAA
jgi:DNA modification methylase